MMMAMRKGAKGEANAERVGKGKEGKGAMDVEREGREARVEERWTER